MTSTVFKATKHHRNRRRLPLTALLMLALMTLPLVTAGCWNLRTGEASIHGIANFTLPAFPQTGSHKVVVFSEMHYSPSFKSQEGPRLLPPPDSVPRTGRELKYSSLQEYAGLTNPNQTFTLTEAKELYRVDCLVCHGPNMTGDGPIVPMINKGPLPANLMSEISINATDGELFAFISKGGRQGLSSKQVGRDSTSPMPEFGLLLKEEERWQLVQYLREMQSR